MEAIRSNPTSVRRAVAAMSAPRRGTLEVNILNAIRLVETQSFGKQDPYCVVRVGEESARTKVCRDGGTAPTWNERFTFQLARVEEELVVRLWNSNSLKSDKCIGSARIPLAKVYAEGYDDVDAKVMTTKGAPGGMLNMVLTWVPAATPAANVTHVYLPGAPAPVAPAPATQRLPTVPNDYRQPGYASEPRYAPQYQQPQQHAYQVPPQHVVQIPGPMGAPTYIHFAGQPQPAPYQPQNIGSYYQGAPAPGGFMPPPPGWAPSPQGAPPPSDDVWG